MRILDDCLTLTREIKDIEEYIMELKTARLSPKSQKLTGMPRGGSPIGNTSDDYMVRLERLEKKKSRKIAARDSLWDEAVKLFCKNNIKPEYIMLMRHRFYRGLQWKQCCTLMCQEYPEQNWNINKVFRAYRKILRINR